MSCLYKFLNMLYTDQMQRRVEVPEKPRRIVSLVPSQTELLYTLGLEKEVVGLTKFCIHPPHWRTEKRVIGGTKNFHFDKIRELQPDLIIGNKEENYQEGIEALEKEFPVWMSDIFTLEDALQMMQEVGRLTDRQEKSRQLAAEIAVRFEQLQPLSPIPTLYFIWQKPYMAVGGNTFIDEMLHRCGFANLLSGKDRYPELSVEDIKALDPSLILLSSEPFPFQIKHIAQFKEICPRAEVMVVDGEMFSWYGSRLQEAVPYLQALQKRLTSVFQL